MVFVRKARACVPVKPYHLHRAYQYHGVLATLFQGGLRDLFGVPFVRAGANLELPCQLRFAVYKRTCACKYQAVEDKNFLKLCRKSDILGKNDKKPSESS